MGSIEDKTEFKLESKAVVTLPINGSVVVLSF